MRINLLIIALASILAGVPAWANAHEHHPKVGGYEQLPPGPTQEEEIGAGWGHRSMTFGMMNLMSGMTTQTASILRSGKATPEMLQRLAVILDHVAWMLNYAPAYMMGTKTVDPGMMKEMQDMLKDLDAMRKEIRDG
ncbi:MAG: hypothetical protein CVU64_11870 [Deltaproteobacteria bacterium HGW-Deltaproteobacteria-21]|nr:MAG: hypothetical protein CVU64_11870 [Deltaproteobacteria bacterium HGW-Deltaproteobacteria-21]